MPKGNGPVTVARVVSVTRDVGSTVGKPASWHDVVGQFADETGGMNIVTKTGPGLIVEADVRLERSVAGLAAAIAVGTVAWAIVSYLT